MMRYGGFGYGMMGYGWGWLMMIVILVLVVLAIWALVRYINNSDHRRDYFHSTGDAQKILVERYAKGEITDEQYKRMKNEMLQR